MLRRFWHWFLNELDLICAPDWYGSDLFMVVRKDGMKYIRPRSNGTWEQHSLVAQWEYVNELRRLDGDINGPVSSRATGR